MGLGGSYQIDSTLKSFLFPFFVAAAISLVLNNSACKDGD